MLKKHHIPAAIVGTAALVYLFYTKGNLSWLTWQDWKLYGTVDYKNKRKEIDKAMFL